jgi:endonuclease/exonuclease/phosphatase family metal-dependent hydrolase
MTWNIHGGRGSARRRDLAGVIRIVQRHDPDIVALQEVDARKRKGALDRAFEMLADALGHHSVEARLILAPDGDYGHILISKCPLAGTRLHDISVVRREPRAAIETTAETPFGPLHIVAAHLGLGPLERVKQAALLSALVEAADNRTVVLGDFNDWGWPGSLHRTLGRHFPDRTEVRTFPAGLPLLRLDRIYCRPAGTLVQSWTDQDARSVSDHLPVVADLHLGASRRLATSDERIGPGVVIRRS